MRAEGISAAISGLANSNRFSLFSLLIWTHLEMAKSLPLTSIGYVMIGMWTYLAPAQSVRRASVPLMNTGTKFQHLHSKA